MNHLHSVCLRALCLCATMLTTTDHVSVRADLSDLADALRWLKTHDEEAQQLVANANALATKYLHKEGILDYMHLCLYQVAQRYDAAFWVALPPTSTSPWHLVRYSFTPRDKKAGIAANGAGAGAGAGAGSSPSESGNGIGDSWFGADNLPYASTPLPVDGPPKVPKLASDCDCDRCQVCCQRHPCRAASTPHQLAAFVGCTSP